MLFHIHSNSVTHRIHRQEKHYKHSLFSLKHVQDGRIAKELLCCYFCDYSISFIWMTCSNRGFDMTDRITYIFSQPFRLSDQTKCTAVKT